MRSFRSVFFVYMATCILAFSKSENDCSEKNNSCISFTVSSGTGCAWMCNYCQSQLGTTNYYFTDGICKYQDGEGCIGNPIYGTTYTCCSV